MHLQAHFQEFVLQASANPVLQQLLPLAVLLTCVALPLAFRDHISASSFSVFNMLQYLYRLVFSTLRHNPSPGSSPPGRSCIRAEEMLERDLRTAVESIFEDGYYTGLVNISGTYCFMNSTLQAFASLHSLLPYLDGLHSEAEALDVPSPVTDSLRDLLYTLNDPQPSPRALRPHAIIDALSHPEPGKRSPLFSSREHQDAQELFQLISELVKKEAAAVDAERSRDRGLGAALDLGYESDEALEAPKLSQRTVFDGLTANRRTCFECGYTEAVMHFSFDSWQLPLPRTSACRLEECLAEYTKLEVLTDCVCRQCSMRETLTRLEKDVERLSADPKPSTSKKKTLRETRKLKRRVTDALEEGRVEEDIKGVKITRVFSRASTKQAMIARPPPVLVLHLNRSLTYGAYASKNSAPVIFPELLNLSPFSTAGSLSTRPEMPISSPGSPSLPVLYRLAAVVCHYGTHQAGHYIAYRRRPPIRPSRLASISPAGDVLLEGKKARPGTGWLRISDDSVSECGIESALAEASGAFMLYYERILPPESELDTKKLSASHASCDPTRHDARILRSVSAGRSNVSDASSSISSDSRGTSMTSVDDDDRNTMEHTAPKQAVDTEMYVAGESTVLS